MNKSELVDAIAQKSGLSKVDSKKHWMRLWMPLLMN